MPKAANSGSVLFGASQAAPSAKFSKNSGSNQKSFSFGGSFTTSDGIDDEVCESDGFDFKDSFAPLEKLQFERSCGYAKKSSLNSMEFKDTNTVEEAEYDEYINSAYDEHEENLEEIQQVLMKGFSAKTISKGALKKFLNDNFRNMGGVPFCQTLLKKASHLENSISYSKVDRIHATDKFWDYLRQTTEAASLAYGSDEEKHCATFVRLLLTSTEEKGWFFKQCVDAHVLNESICDVMHAKGLKSLGSKITEAVIQLVSNIAVILYLLAHYLTDSDSLETVMANMLKAPIFLKELQFIQQLENENALIYSTLGLGSNWEMFIVNYLEIQD